MDKPDLLELSAGDEGEKSDKPAATHPPPPRSTPDSAPSPPARAPEPTPKKSGFFKSLGTWLMVLLMIGLTGAVLYLLSDINRRTYRLAQVGQQMVVQKGKFFPTGFEAYTPSEERLLNAYSPVTVPTDSLVPGGQVFEDRTDLDRALFAILAGWAREHLGSDDVTLSSQAAQYIERCIQLPGVSEEQRKDIAILRADLSYRQGQSLLAGIVQQLEAAALQFKQAIEEGTSFQNEAAESLMQVQTRIDALMGQAAQERAPQAVPNETDGSVKRDAPSRETRKPLLPGQNVPAPPEVPSEQVPADPSPQDKEPGEAEDVEL